MLFPAAAADSPIKFGPYLLTECVGQGGMAVVYKAMRQGPSGFAKTVVVKAMLPSLSAQREFVGMFSAEARLMAQLTHPNIVQVQDFGVVDGVPYLVMEYLAGRNLSQLRAALATARRKLPIGAALTIAREMCHGLGYAHQFVDEEGKRRRVIHRDVSPSNVMVCRDGSVKLLDFGVAKIVGEFEFDVTQSLKGKYAYMAPEQVGHQPVDCRVDVFAAGVVLHEMLTGKRLFAANTELETLQRVSLAQVVAPSVDNRDVPRELDAIVKRALARYPGERYASGAELAEAIETLDAQAWSRKRLASFMAELFASEWTITCEVCGKSVMPGSECAECGTAAPDCSMPIAIAMTAPGATHLAAAGVASFAASNAVAEASIEAPDGANAADAKGDAGEGDALVPLNNGQTDRNPINEPMPSLPASVGSEPLPLPPPPVTPVPRRAPKLLPNDSQRPQLHIVHTPVPPPMTASQPAPLPAPAPAAKAPLPVAAKAPVPGAKFQFSSPPPSKFQFPAPAPGAKPASPSVSASSLLPPPRSPIDAGTVLEAAGQIDTDRNVTLPPPAAPAPSPNGARDASPMNALLAKTLREPSHPNALFGGNQPDSSAQNIFGGQTQRDASPFAMRDSSSGNVVSAPAARDSAPMNALVAQTLRDAAATAESSRSSSSGSAATAAAVAPRDPTPAPSLYAQTPENALFADDAGEPPPPHLFVVPTTPVVPAAFVRALGRRVEPTLAPSPFARTEASRLRTDSSFMRESSRPSPFARESSRPSPFAPGESSRPSSFGRESPFARTESSSPQSRPLFSRGPAPLTFSRPSVSTAHIVPRSSNAPFIIFGLVVLAGVLFAVFAAVSSPPRPDLPTVMASQTTTPTTKADTPHVISTPLVVSPATNASSNSAAKTDSATEARELDAMLNSAAHASTPAIVRPAATATSPSRASHAAPARHHAAPHVARPAAPVDERSVKDGRLVDPFAELK